MHLPVNPPVLPMLSKRIGALPAGGAWIFEPKWDGFRALIFRDGDEILIQSRDEKPLNRYFPELLDPCSAIAGALRARWRNRDRHGQRARFRGAAAAPSSGRLAREAAVAADSGFDRVLRPALRWATAILRNEPFENRRRNWSRCFASAEPPVHLTPATTRLRHCRGLVSPFRRRGTGWRDGQSPLRHSTNRTSA